MKIREYIRDQVFGKRAQTSSLIIYDPDRRYREIVRDMESPTRSVIDAGLSVIEQREAAMAALQGLSEGRIQACVIWVPSVAPEGDEELQRDPFSVFCRLGSCFPAGDGDEYQSLCRRAKPDHLVEIGRLFADGDPSFETIDALDSGGSWPKLKTLLAANSPKEILIGLLSPKPAQDAALKSDSTWANEARSFVERTLEHKLKTKGQMRQPIAEELWQLLLFSEFVFDSGDLPTSLSPVPRAGVGSKGLVFEVCEELRRHEDHKDAYLTHAVEIELHLALAERTAAIVNLGQRDTFAFEERQFLTAFADDLLQGNSERAREILTSRQKSIWLTHEDRLAAWTVAERTLDLVDATLKHTTPSFSSLEEIIRAYSSSWRELDRRHREMEQSVAEWHEDDAGLERLVSVARTAYLKIAANLQMEFIRLVQAEGWPSTGSNLLSNSQIFDREVAPFLESGQRTAYFLIDSLRFELAVELEKQLADKHTVRLLTSCAQLPTYTEVGMAGLMPDAGKALWLANVDGKLVTTLEGSAATTPASRFAYMQRRKGDQCADIDLDELVRSKKVKIAEKTRLLVVRTRDIDSIAHDSPHQVLQVVPSLVRLIIRGINKLENAGFQKVVIATDHGFILLHENEPGNLVPKPPGKWLVEKCRCLLGEGSADSGSLVFNREQVGIPGDFVHYAVPRTLGTYSRGHLYYHEGLSLQECILPCLSVELKAQAKKVALPELQLSYRQGKTDKITQRRPVLDLSWPGLNLFGDDYDIEVIIEAVDPKGNVVGWVGSGQTVNPATQGVRIRPGQVTSFSLRMEDQFSGSFTVRALDQSTQALIADVTLKTAYLE